MEDETPDGNLSDLDQELIALASQMPKPRKSELEEELGVPSYLPFGSWYDFSAAHGGAEIANTNPVGIDALVEMRRRDGQARALMRLFTYPIRAAVREGKWQSPDGDENMPEAKFAQDMFYLPPAAGGMSSTVSRFVRECLLGVVEGFSVFEEVRHVPKDGPLKGKVVLKKLAHRDSTTVRFVVDDEGGFNGVRQVAHRPTTQEIVDVHIPREKSWYWAANEEENPFYGVSFFESAWYHYDIKKRLYYIAHIAAQQAAVPGRVGEVPANADPKKVTAFRKALADFAFNTAMTHPENYKVTPFSMNSQFDFLKLIDHHNHMMSKSVLAGFLDEENRQTLIDNGTADASSDLFVMTVESIMHGIEENLTNYLMPKYIDWNFGGKNYPVFKFGQIADSARDVVKEMLVTIASAQSSQWTPEFIREMEKQMAARLGLEVDYDEVEKREEEEQKKVAKMEEMNRKMLAQQLGGPDGEEAEEDEGAEEDAPPNLPGAETAGGGEE